MAGATPSFLAFAAAVILLTNLFWRPGRRQAILLIASLAFLWLCAAGESLIPLLAFTLLGYIGLKGIERGWIRTATPLIVVTILSFVWLKNYTFVPSPLFLRNSYTTLGLSYILFRLIHLLEDAKNNGLPGPVSLPTYLTYTLNFTTLIAGPIQRFQEFEKSWREARPLSVVRAGAAVERIITGFFKVNVIALALSDIQADAIKRVTAPATWESHVLAGAIVIASYPFFLYCNFSGYIDIVIGIGRWIGIDLPENFDRPFSAESFIDLWNRWHITLSKWLKAYVYNPLLMALMRRFPADALAPVWSVAAYFVTFFLVGAWHGQTSAFLFFGVLQGLGVSLNKLYEILMGRKRLKKLAAHGVYLAASRGLTFTFFAFSLAWFWSTWQQLGSLTRTMGAGGSLAALTLVFVAATTALALWEALRNSFLRIEWQGESLLRSRYTRTAWCTALVWISVATELLIRQQAPEIVYRRF